MALTLQLIASKLRWGKRNISSHMQRETRLASKFFAPTERPTTNCGCARVSRHGSKWHIGVMRPKGQKKLATIFFIGPPITSPTTTKNGLQLSTCRDGL